MHHHVLTDLPIIKNGYLYIYVSNETPNIAVFFDNLQVMHTPGPLLEETHYYPFGLTMAGISSKAAGGLENNVKFGGKELQSDEFSDNSGLEMYDFGARYFDPQIGRWHTIDPMAEGRPELTSYHYVSNNPINRTDPDGRWDDWVEDGNGDVTWRDDVTAENHTTVLKEGEIYRGTSFQRDKVWLNVNVRGNSETGLMRENYKPDGKMEYDNLTPWVDKAFEELGVARFAGDASNPRIEQYLTYTQLKGADINDATSWCAGFANFTLETSGINGTDHATALSFRGNWGQNLEAPAFGSIATMSYGKGKGHVGIVVGTNSTGQILILGGNQGSASGGQNEVNISPNSPTKFQYHYPKGLAPYYNLPILNIRGKSINYGNTR